MEYQVDYKPSPIEDLAAARVLFIDKDGELRGIKGFWKALGFKVTHGIQSALSALPFLHPLKPKEITDKTVLEGVLIKKIIGYREENNNPQDRHLLHSDIQRIATKVGLMPSNLESQWRHQDLHKVVQLFAATQKTYINSGNEQSAQNVAPLMKKALEHFVKEHKSELQHKSGNLFEKLFLTFKMTSFSSDPERADSPSRGSAHTTEETILPSAFTPVSPRASPSSSMSASTLSGRTSTGASSPSPSPEGAGRSSTRSAPLPSRERDQERSFSAPPGLQGRTPSPRPPFSPIGRDAESPTDDHEPGDLSSAEEEQSDDESVGRLNSNTTPVATPRSTASPTSMSESSISRSASPTSRSASPTSMSESSLSRSASPTSRSASPASAAGYETETESGIEEIDIRPRTPSPTNHPSRSYADFVPLITALATQMIGMGAVYFQKKEPLVLGQTALSLFRPGQTPALDGREIQR